eukprot:scaffold10621_cov18-Tisochrysis_lutea.AAC.5
MALKLHKSDHHPQKPAPAVACDFNEGKEHPTSGETGGCVRIKQLASSGSTQDSHPKAAPTVPSSSGICSTAAAVGGGDGGSGDVGWGSTAGASAARGTRSCCCCLCSWGQQAGREMQQCSGGGGARGQAGGEGLQHIHCLAFVAPQNDRVVGS